MKTLRYTMTAGMLFSFALIACGPSGGDGRLNADSNAIAGLNGEGGDGCTLTQGYWKNHPGAWPTDALTIGGVTYSKAQLLKLFATAPQGDTSLILGHQLIAALLNGASGANAPAEVASALNDAEAWMTANKDADGTLPYGVKSGAAAAAAVALSETLASFNEGGIGPGHCDGGPGSGSGGTTTGSGGTTSSSSGGGTSCGPDVPACLGSDLICPPDMTCFDGCCSPVPR